MTESTSTLSEWTDRLAALGFLGLWAAFTYGALWALKNIRITVGHADSITEQDNDHDH